MIKLVAWVIHILDVILPKRNAVVLRGYPDLEDQCISLLIALSRIQYQGKVTWILTGLDIDLSRVIEKYGLENLKLETLKHSGLRAILEYLFSRYVFFTHGLYTHPFWKNQKPPRSKMVVNLWHGMPFKQLWKPLGDPAAPAHVLLATSEVFQKILSTLSGMPEETVWVTGLPRNDMLFYKDAVAKTAISDLVDGLEWFLYLPTYRQSRENPVGRRLDGVELNSVLNMSKEDALELDAWLSSVGKKIVVKAHPSSIHSRVNNSFELKNIVIIPEAWLCENLITLYELAGYSQGLITDVSSILVDYLLLDRPIFIYFPDRDVYERSRGFVFESLDENLPGMSSANIHGLISHMDRFVKGDDTGKECRQRLRGKFHADLTPTSASRLLERLGI